MQRYSSKSWEKEYEAKVIGADPYMDIAVLKMETKDKFKPVIFGDSR